VAGTLLAGFRGSVVERDKLQAGGTGTHPDCDEIDVGASALAAAIAKTKSNKGMGRDAIQNELLKVGGEALACRLSDLAQRVAREESWPIEWKGGRIIDLFKHKGSPFLCDSYREILLASRMMKVVLVQIMKPLTPVVELRLPAEQLGGVRKRGTDFGIYIISSFLEAAGVEGWSAGVLYVDLVEAFDTVLRELIFGSPLLSSSSGLEWRGLKPFGSSSGWERKTTFSVSGMSTQNHPAPLQLARRRVDCLR
jgi:hypothetical protein